MEMIKVLKAMADESRFKIIRLLLEKNYCVRALSKKLHLSESAISQHLKVLREAGLIVGEKRGYFMHYDVDRDMLHQLSSQIKELAAIKRGTCRPEKKGCVNNNANCHRHKS